MNTHRLMPVALLPAIKDAIVETGGCFQPESLWTAIITAFDQVQQAAPIQSGDTSELVQRLNDYANEPGYSHGDYADTMKQAAAALTQRGDVRNQALEEAAKIAEGFCAVGDDPDEESINLVLKQRAQRIRALASTPSAAMQGQGVPDGYVLVPRQMTDEMRDRGNEIILNRCNLVRAYAAMLASAPTPPAAQPQAGGRELTDADVEWLASHFGTRAKRKYVNMLGFARAIEAHITGTKGATE